ncbi:hypothetical protein SLE2022_357730 [Rubroshorea leprosula]
MDRKLLGVKKEKLSHFRLYWHDIVSGRNPSSIPVVQFVNSFWVDQHDRQSPDAGAKTEFQDGGKGTRVLLLRFAGGSRAVDGHEFCFHRREIQWKHDYNPGKEPSVCGGEGDAGGQRKWTFPVCKRVCSGKDSMA